MDRKNKNGVSRPDDFIRYSKDGMSGSERNSFEKELQKDPFAEEAAEGFSFLQSSELEQDLKTLEDRIRKRTAKRSYTAIYRIAAGFAILVSISVAYYYSARSREETVLTDALIINQDTSAGNELVIAQAEPLRKARESVSVPLTPISPSPSLKLKQTDIQTATSVKEEENDAVKEEMKDAEVMPSDTKAEVNRLAEAAADEAGILQEQEADKKGEYRRISGLAAPAAAKSSLAAEHQVPVPVTGIDSFNIYLEKNQRNPEPEGKSELFVLVSFIVKPDSTVSKIRIIESPGKKWSDEAKRLIIEGPRWVPASLNGKLLEETITIKILFR